MSPLRLTDTAVKPSKRRPAAISKRPFDQHARDDLRRLLAALREIGDRLDLDQVLQRYDVSEARLKAFVKEVEGDALVEESLCQ